MTTNIHNGDVGTIIRLTITDSAGTAIDVSTASTKYIYLKPPSGTREQKTAAFYTDGTDGIIQYTTVDGDIELSGIWQAQGYVETSDGKFYTAKTNIAVLSVL